MGAMPKERIYGQQRGAVASPLECDVLVQWDKASEWMERGDNLGGSGVVSLALVPSTEDAPDGVLAYVYLDRVAINRLIERLRRARDAAFGRDA